VCPGGPLYRAVRGFHLFRPVAAVRGSRGSEGRCNDWIDFFNQEKNLHPIISRTFGGLSGAYYFRQFVFGLILAGIVAIPMSSFPGGVPIPLVVLIALNVFLYPYARFVYESVVNFIVGQNLFILPAIVMLMFKVFTMAMCFAMAIVIAPIGLVYLYWHHTKQARQG